MQIGRVLVENALVHTPVGTSCALTTPSIGGRATLTVANDGPAIPDEAHERIFERFYRLDGGRVRERPRPRDRPGAGGGDGRPDRDRVRAGWTLFTLALSAEVPEREPTPDLV